MSRDSMDRMYRGGPWYVVDFHRREFVRYTKREGEAKDRVSVTWTPRICWAKAYKNPSAAIRATNMINAQRGRIDCQALGYDAAECVDRINRRDGLPIRGNRGMG